jgi:hypothetical protein
LVCAETKTGVKRLRMVKQKNTFFNIFFTPFRVFYEYFVEDYNPNDVRIKSTNV